MKIKIFLILTFFFAQNILSQESQGDQLEFMSRFFCVMSTQQYIHENREALPANNANAELPDSWRKILALTFRECLEDVKDQYLLTQLAGARTKEELDKIKFPYIERINLKKFVEEKEFTMTEDDFRYLDMSRTTAEQIQKMQEEQQKNEKGGKSDRKSDGSSKKSGKNKENKTTAKFDILEWVLNSQFRNVFIFSGIAIVLVLLNTLMNLCRKKPEVGDKKQGSKKANKNDKTKEKNE